MFLMWKTYYRLASQYPRISLDEERQLIAYARGRSKEKRKSLFFAMVVLLFFGFIRRPFQLMWHVMGRISFPRLCLFCMIKPKPTTWSIKTDKGILSLSSFLFISGSGLMVL